MFALRIAVDLNNQEESTKQLTRSSSSWPLSATGTKAWKVLLYQQVSRPSLFTPTLLDISSWWLHWCTEKHAAQVEPFKYIGLVAGQPFCPDQLSKVTQAGLARAALIGPDIIKWKVKYSYMGIPYEAHTRWTKFGEGTYNFNSELLVLWKGYSCMIT